MNSSKAELQFLQFPQQNLNKNRKTTKQYMAKIRQENEPFASRSLLRQNTKECYESTIETERNWAANYPLSSNADNGLG